MSTTDARTELERIAAAGPRRWNAGSLQDIAKVYLVANPRRNGAERISAERVRQVVDRTEHADGSLLHAAQVLMLEYDGEDSIAQIIIDGSPSWVGSLSAHAVEKYAGRDRYRLLEIAAALIAAELDRLAGAS